MVECSLVDNVGAANRALSDVFSNTCAARMDVQQPSSVAPSYKELLRSPFLTSGRFAFGVVFAVGWSWTIFLGLQGVVVDPFDATFPHASHVLPAFSVRSVDVGNAFPGRVGVCALKLEMRAHDLDALLVDPCYELGGVGELDGAYAAFARVQDRVPSGILAEANGSQPARCRGRGAVCVRVGAHASLASDSQDQIPGEASRDVSPVSLELGRKRNCLHRAREVAEGDVLGVDKSRDTDMAVY